MHAEFTSHEVVTEVRGRVGFITLNRPKALNALNLPMIRALTATLLAWRNDDGIGAVAIRGSNKVGRPGTPESLFGGFCAGGDIRFFHTAALAGNPELEDFFTEEYALNHLIQTYPKPYIAFMDGVVMGGGMGLSQGAAVRIVTERTKMAMPETQIGLFPDVGGGYFLSRCPGHVGEWLALCGDTIGAQDAIAAGLADCEMPSARLGEAWESLGQMSVHGKNDLAPWLATFSIAVCRTNIDSAADINHFFSQPTMSAIVQALEHSSTPWALKTAATLRKRSPLMLHVSLELVRRARTLSLADDLRLERDLVRHCFQLRPGAASETVEGIRALAVDKDHSPKWNPSRIEDVSEEQVIAFFKSPWPKSAHPLVALHG